ncbi:MAG: hypothetical protein AAF824_21970 [Bacteroidota bacterium]
MKFLQTSFCILVTACLMGFPYSAKASGWPQPKGSAYLKLGQYLIISDQYFAPSGDVIDITTTGFYSTYLYAEYGLTDRLTVSAYMPFFVRSTLNEVETTDGDLLNEGDEVNSFGDTDISLKYGLFQKNNWAVSASLTLGLPLGEPQGGNTELLQTGDGEFNQLLAVEVSRSFQNGNAFVSALVGINNRTENFSDEFRYGVEGGVKVANKHWFILKINGIESLQNGDAASIANNGIFSNNLEYVAITPEFNFQVKDNWGVSLAVGGAPIARRVLAAPSFNVGLFATL